MFTKEVRAGKRYGLLKVVGVAERNGMRLAKCACKCGGSTTVCESLLIFGVTRSCGCRSCKAKNLTYMRFGKLIALEPVEGRGADGSIRWRCVCDCGKEVVVSSNKLRMKRTKSCGCGQEGRLLASKTFVAGTCLELIASEKLSKNNHSGVKGVARKGRGWQAYISMSRRQYFLGTYARLDEACEARRLAEQARSDYVLRALTGQDQGVAFEELLRQYLNQPQAMAEGADRRRVHA